MCQVVITGAGVVSSLGATLAEFKQRMFASESGAIDIRGKLVAANFPVSAAAPVLEIPKLPDIFSEFEPTEVPHVLQLAGSATQQALEFLPEGILIDGVVFGGQDTVSSGHSCKSLFSQ